MVVNGLINISISTIEKRYELNSSLTGLISASYDISFCVLSLFVSFFGERGHKPRWLAFSAFMLGLGSLTFSLPHFSSGKYHFGTKLEGKIILVFWKGFEKMRSKLVQLLHWYNIVNLCQSPKNIFNLKIKWFCEIQKFKGCLFAQWTSIFRRDPSVGISSCS